MAKGAPGVRGDTEPAWRGFGFAVRVVSSVGLKLAVLVRGGAGGY